MDEFTNRVNRYWSEVDPFVLAAYVLWRLTYIHPFINGNGRTARAACLFVLSVRYGQWIPTKEILPDLIRQNQSECVRLLRAIDNVPSNDDFDQKLGEIAQFLHQLVTNYWS
ncbi:MAG: Fic family protein [Aestuariivita sp.]|nr:Fic family protein [Aestuariivita sp.]